MKELWVPLSAAKAQQRKVETIANNVANANTTAFKKDRMVFREYLSAYEKGTDIDLPNKEWAPEDFYRSYGAENAHPVIDGSFTNFGQGQIRPTNNPLDIALKGKGFLEVSGPNGTRYTRRGNLFVNQQGQIVTDQGMKVLAKIELPQVDNDQELIQQLKEAPPPEQRTITLQKGPVNINQQGEIFQNGNLLARLSIVEFKNSDVLTKEGNSLFINNDTRNILRGDPQTTIHQGALEGSNVNTVEEMSNLIKAHRNLESIQRVIKTYDNMANKAYNDIARF